MIVALVRPSGTRPGCRRRLLALWLVAGVAAGCGADAVDIPAQSVAAAPASTVADASTIPTTTITVASPDTTFAIEVRLLAEAHGITPEEARDVLIGQARQGDAYQRLWDLVDPELLVEGASFNMDLSRGDEFTIYVVDSDAVAVVTEKLEVAGFDLAKTTVEVYVDDEPSFLEEHLQREPYTQYEWLASPDPYLVGGWNLIESAGEPVAEPITVGFGTSAWGVLECNSDIGRYFTSADQTVQVDIDLDSAECGDATDRIDQHLARPIADSSGNFEVAFEDQTMIWTGSRGHALVWERDESEDPHEDAPAAALSAWLETPAPDMEGVWTLTLIGTEAPPASATLYVGVSTWDFDGLCNSLGGLYAMTADGIAAFAGSQTLMHCGNNPSMQLEEQFDAVLVPNDGLFEISVKSDTMTWTGVNDGILVWRRS